MLTTTTVVTANRLAAELDKFAQHVGACPIQRAGYTVCTCGLSLLRERIRIERRAQELSHGNLVFYKPLTV